ncbi:MAG: ABC transporter ATP-binding protein [Thermoplasmata archaeon]|jgi:peptide/nickel transport system ATP-binding protein
MIGNTVVKVENVKKYYELHKGLLSFGPSLTVKAVDGISFELHEGEIIGIVGETGSGKTTTGRMLVLLERPTSGKIYFEGTDISELKGNKLKEFRKNVQMVFQDPYESLNPRFTILKTLMEPLIIHKIGDTFEERVDIVIRALEDAGLKPGEEYLGRYPHEVSGGQRQRIAIARALVTSPKFIVADEPVSMLDVSIRAGVLNLMLDLREKLRIPFIFITHDIAVARYMSDRIFVMYLGKIVEYGSSEDVIFDPLHPYTRSLVAAIPVPDPDRKHERVLIKGEIPSPINVPPGCKFITRCVYAQKGICDVKEPELREVKPGHFVACHFAEQIMNGELKPKEEDLQKDEYMM